METMNRARQWNERGQAIVELALTLPLLLLIVMGVFDFGLMFQRFEIVANAAREGARVGVLPDYTVPHQAEIHAERYLNAGGITSTAATSNSAGCNTSVVAGTICVSAVPNTTTIPASGGAAAKTVDTIVVTVTYDHEHVFVGPIMALFGGSGSGSTRLKAVSIMRKE
jgi:Flp pilus assembly protein TadG